MKEKNKTLVIKGVPTEFADNKFKEILDSNKIQYAKADCMKSRRDSRSLKMFQLELKDPAEVKALISENLTCHQTGIIFKAELQFRSGSVITAKNFGHLAKNCQAKTKCVICGEGHLHKGCPNKEKKATKVCLS